MNISYADIWIQQSSFFADTVDIHQTLVPGNIFLEKLFCMDYIYIRGI